MPRECKPLWLRARSRLRQFVACCGITAVAAIGAAAAHAEGNWPDRPLKFVVPVAVGSGADAIARLYGARLSEALGQPVVIDNRVGAAGAIAAEYAARSAPDGYTIFLGTQSTQASNVAMFKKLPYDPLKSFDAVSLLGNFPLILVVNPALPANDLKALLDLARARPGKLTFAYGTGSAQVTGELLRTLSKTDLLLVPYKSNPLALNAVIGGEVDMMVMDPGPVKPFIESGGVRALAVTTGKRSSVVPDLPTMAQAGLPGYELYGWNAALVPAGTPKPIILRLNAEFTRIAAQPEMRQKLAQVGVEAQSSTPEQLQELMASELGKWSTLIRNAGIAPE